MLCCGTFFCMDGNAKIDQKLDEHGGGNIEEENKAINQLSKHPWI